MRNRLGVTHTESFMTLHQEQESSQVCHNIIYGVGSRDSRGASTFRAPKVSKIIGLVFSSDFGMILLELEKLKPRLCRYQVPKSLT
jgi:hypothetical protein